MQQLQETWREKQDQKIQLLERKRQILQAEKMLLQQKEATLMSIMGDDHLEDTYDTEADLDWVCEINQASEPATTN